MPSSQSPQRRTVSASSHWNGRPNVTIMSFTSFESFGTGLTLWMKNSNLQFRSLCVIRQHVTDSIDPWAQPSSSISHRLAYPGRTASKQHLFLTGVLPLWLFPISRPSPGIPMVFGGPTEMLCASVYAGSSWASDSVFLKARLSLSANAGAREQTMDTTGQRRLGGLLAFWRLLGRQQRLKRLNECSDSSSRSLRVGEGHSVSCFFAFCSENHSLRLKE